MSLNMLQLTHLLKKEREKKAIPREEVKGSNALKNLATFTKKGLFYYC